MHIKLFGTHNISLEHPPGFFHFDPPVGGSHRTFFGGSKPPYRVGRGWVAAMTVCTPFLAKKIREFFLEFFREFLREFFREFFREFKNGLTCSAR